MTSRFSPDWPLPPAAAIDPSTGLYRLNHPAFLLHLLRCGLVMARQAVLRWWHLRTWSFLFVIVRDRAEANGRAAC